MTLRKQHDKLNRLQQISFTTNATAPSGSYGYLYNNANQRTRTTFADGSYWVYDYDSLGQVKSGKKYWSDGTPVAGQQFEYAFDDIGNRTSTKAGGNAVGAALRAASYTANRLNQYSSRTVPGAVDVIGAAKATASVTVNSVAATTRRVEYYHKEVAVANTAGDIWQSVSVAASEGGNNETLSGNVFIPQTPETNTFDLDGNQTTDGRWTYTWDGENRLTRMVANTAVGPQQRIDFEYDWLGRRISRKVWNNTAGTGTPALEQRFLYDNWNLLAIVDGAFNPTHSFVWGNDLSGSMHGAGGIGGLVSMTVHSGANAGTYFYSYDGNGNVVGLVNAANGSIAAQYEYSPFGEPLRATGPLAKVNPVRFSSKFTDDESDLVYYGYRFYSAGVGRWLSRDPIQERGGGSLHGFVGNEPLRRWDHLGLYPGSGTTWAEKKWWWGTCGNCSGKARKVTSQASRIVDEAWKRQVDGSFVNALKHCTWMCSVASLADCGPEAARKLGEAHEDYRGNPRDHKAMDLYNNNVGVGIAKTGNSPQQCYDACLSQLKQNKLYFFEKTSDVDPYDEEKGPVPPFELPN